MRTLRDCFPALLLATALTACGSHHGFPGEDAARGDAADVTDAPTLDASDSASDGALDALDAHADGGLDAPVDGAPDAPVCGCSAHEVCGDGYDNDCNGLVDDHCACLPGTTQRCLPGTPSPDAPLCAFGQQACEGSGEFGQWGACTGVGSYADAATSAYACRRILLLGTKGWYPSANFQDWLQRNGAIVTRLQTMATDGPLRRELLDTFDVVILDWLQRTYTVDEANALRDWVAAGGGLMSMAGYDAGNVSDQRQISLLQSLGVNYVVPTHYGDPTAVLATFVPHPISMLTGGGLIGPVTFAGGLAVATQAGFAGSATNVATIPNPSSGGAPVVVGVAGTLGMGRFFVYGDEWVQFDSEWMNTTMPEHIEDFWFNSIGWLNEHPGHPVDANCE